MISVATEKYDKHMKRLNTEFAAAQKSERSAQSSAAQTLVKRTESYGRSLTDVADDEGKVADTHATMLVEYNKERRALQLESRSTTVIDRQWTKVQKKTAAQREALAQERLRISDQSTRAAQEVLERPTLRRYRH
jgi:hypothetical protein